MDKRADVGTSRRAMLLGAGAAGAAGLLAACGSGAPGPQSGATQPAPSATGTAGGAPATTAPGGGGGTPIAEIPLGGGKIFTDRGIVVTRPTQSEIKAFATTCPHQGCQVTEIRDGRIICPCHDSEFNIADGSVAKNPNTGQPLRQGLSPHQVTVTGDTFTVS